MSCSYHGKYDNSDYLIAAGGHQACERLTKKVIICYTVTIARPENNLTKTFSPKNTIDARETNEPLTLLTPNKREKNPNPTILQSE